MNVKKDSNMDAFIDKALDLEKNIFIKACAGSGKTWLLSKRYNHILDDFIRQSKANKTDVSAKNILVITFTKKAANEMAQRIYDDLSKLLSGEKLEGLPPSYGQHLIGLTESEKLDLQSTLAQNAISTVDSFSAKIVREFASILNIDPDFMTDDEDNIKKQVEEALDAYLHKASSDHDVLLRQLLETLSVFQVESYLKYLWKHQYRLSFWIQHQFESDLETLKQELILRNPLPENLSELIPEFEILARCIPPKSAVIDINEKKYTQLLEFKDALQSCNPQDYLSASRLIKSVGVLLLHSKGMKYLSRFDFKKKNFLDLEYYASLISCIKALGAQLSAIWPVELYNSIASQTDFDALLVTKNIVRFFRPFQEKLRQTFANQNLYSFNDIAYLAKKLVTENPHVAQRLGKRYSHILLDEFQDTNDVRWDFISTIAKGGSDVFPTQGLFIVGDSKQSIYRFNNADVEVMNRVEKIFKPDEILSRDITFRSSKAFVSQVINPLMETVFFQENPKHTPLYDTVFSPTITPENDAPLGSKNHVLLQVDFNLLSDENANSTNHARLAAMQIRRYLDFREAHGLEKEKSPFVGVLLRKFTNIETYIKVFTEMGIDFQVVASKGLYKTQEAFDLFNWLSVMINPFDNLALIGLLRSPFIAMSDANIQSLMGQNDDTSKRQSSISGYYWDALKRYYPDVYSTIYQWQNECASRPIDRILDEIIHQDDRLLGWLTESTGENRIYNIDKLIHLLHIQSLAGKNLREIHDTFTYDLTNSDKALADNSETSLVQIMTIHKAKGLEFPTVILPELDGRSQSDRDGILSSKDDSGEYECGISLQEIDTSAKTNAHKRIQKQNRLENEAEEKRLLYVAVTRARYAVAFSSSGNSKDQIKGHWWSSYIGPTFGLNNLSDIESMTGVDGFHAQLYDENDFEILDGIDNNHGKTSPQNSIQAYEYPIAKKRLQSSPHGIMDRIFPNAFSDTVPAEFNPDEAPTGKTFGLLVHKVLEEDWLNVHDFETDIRDYLLTEDLDDIQIENYIQTLQNFLETFLKSTLHQRILATPMDKQFREIDITAELESDDSILSVRGILDLLLYEKGEWRVIDYKTDQQIPDGIEEGKHAYWIQMQSYLWMLKFCFNIDAKAELYFFRHDMSVVIENDFQSYAKKLETAFKTKNWHLSAPQTNPLENRVGDFLKFHSEENTIVIAPTVGNAEYLKNQLISHGCNTPWIQIKTLSEIKSMVSNEKKLSPHHARVVLSNILDKETRWGDIRLLADALLARYEKGEALIDEFPSKIQLAFQNWCQANGYYSHEGTASTHLKNTHILVYHYWGLVLKDAEIIRQLAEVSKSFTFINQFETKLATSFAWSSATWKHYSEKNMTHTPVMTMCQSVDEECEFVASEVYNRIRSGLAYHQIRIGVSSMERYIPILKRHFESYGIPVLISKREPVTERPLFQWVYAVLRTLNARFELMDIVKLWNHPVSFELFDFTKGQRLQAYKIDAFIRHEDIQTSKELSSRNTKNSVSQEAIDALIAFESLLNEGKSALRTNRNLSWFFELLDHFSLESYEAYNRMNQRVVIEIKRTWMDLSEIWTSMKGTSFALGDFLNQWYDLVQSKEIATSEQRNGVEISSFLEMSVPKATEHIFMGFTESQFPVAIPFNPYIDQDVENVWRFNLATFKYWVHYLPGTISFTSSESDMSGDALKRSSFSQYCDVRSLNRSMISNTSKRKRFFAKRYQTIEKARTWQEQRHNDFLSHQTKSAFKGFTDFPYEKLEIEMSPHSFNALLKCPQKYWFEKVLKIEKLDAQPEESRVLGNIVHEILEATATKDVLKQLRNEASSTAEIWREIEEKAKETLLKSRYKLPNDLLTQKRYALYLKNFNHIEMNLISNLLMELSHLLPDDLSDVEIRHEAGFSRKENATLLPVEIDLKALSKTLVISGRIDWILKRGDAIDVIDFKTGDPKLKEIETLLDSQLYWYYQAMRQNFRAFSTAAFYAKLKSFTSGKYGLSVAMGDADRCTQKKDIILENGTEIAENWQTIIDERMMSLVEGNFPISSQIPEACRHCNFEMICRKTCYED